MTEQRKRTCSSCRYWVEIIPDKEQDESKLKYGECHKNAPSDAKADLSIHIRRFPLTFEHDWCGQWEDPAAWLTDMFRVV